MIGGEETEGLPPFFDPLSRSTIHFCMTIEVMVIQGLPSKVHAEGMIATTPRIENAGPVSSSNVTVASELLDRLCNPSCEAAGPVLLVPVRPQHDRCEEGRPCRGKITLRAPSNRSGSTPRILASREYIVSWRCRCMAWLNLVWTEEGIERGGRELAEHID